MGMGLMSTIVSLFSLDMLNEKMIMTGSNVV